MFLYGLDLHNLKISLASKVKKLTGELTMTSEQKQMLKELFSSEESNQMDAAMRISKSHDIRLLAMLQFYMQDDFLDEVLKHFGGKEFHYKFAQKKMIKFYSLVAASNMLSDVNFFESVVSTISNPTESKEERCDLAYMMGEVFESFGRDIHAREATYISERIGKQFVRTLLTLLSSEGEPDEVRVASVLALHKTIFNPNISTNLEPELAKEVFARLKEYGDVVG